MVRPVFEMTIDKSYGDGRELGWDITAITADPAIGVKGFAFQKNSFIKVEFKDNVQMKLVAPVMIPDVIMPREDGYDVVFKRETIKEIYEKYQAKEHEQYFNIDHIENTTVPGKFIESWIVEDSKTDRAFVEFGIKVPEGTLMAIAQFTDRKFFDQEVVGKGRLGFSIEGWLGMKPAQFKSMFERKMEKNKFEAVKTSNGVDVWVDGEIAVDSYVYSNEPSYVLIDGVKTEMKYPYWNNIIELEDGRILTLANSKIVEIKDKEVKTELKMEKKKFSGAVLEDGTKIWIDKMEVGSEVKVLDEDGEKELIFDGEHKLEDGSTVVTVAGKITEIKPKVEEVAAEEEKPATETKLEVGEAEVMAIVQPKLDELIAMIAEIKAAVTTDEVELKEEDEKKVLNVHERFAALTAFTKKTNARKK